VVPWILALLGAAMVAGGCAKQEPAGGQQSPGDAAQGSPSGATAGSALPARLLPGAHEAFSERRQDRNDMVEQTIASRDVTDPRVLRAMRKVPRHHFVPQPARSEAYEDHPLPIGEGQTISQPYIVAYMTQAAEPGPGDKCLEIGTGSGYQAAVLAELCDQTFSIEYLPRVARRGERNLRSLGYGPDRVQLRVGDGYRGWPEAAPFDVVIVTAAPEEVPAPLLAQLAVGGKLVVPVGSQSGYQKLERWTRLRAGEGRGAFKVESLMGVSFVPFLGEHGAE
jgi:protein-L-isoaspartate(D-aspartate) O-methyltransferase